MQTINAPAPRSAALISDIPRTVDELMLSPVEGTLVAALATIVKVVEETVPFLKTTVSVCVPSESVLRKSADRVIITLPFLAVQLTAPVSGEISGTGDLSTMIPSKRSNVSESSVSDLNLNSTAETVPGHAEFSICYNIGQLFSGGNHI